MNNINHFQFWFLNANIRYFDCYKLYDTKTTKIILLGDLRHIKNDKSFLNKKIKNKKILNITDFYSLSCHYVGGYAALIIQENIIKVFANANFPGLYYSFDDNKNLLISDEISFFGNYLKFQINEKELLHRYHLGMASPTDTVVPSVRIITGFSSFEYNGNLVKNRSWALDYFDEKNKDLVNKNIYKTFEPWLKSLSIRGKKLFLLMSGGIDSTFLALILRDYGYSFTPICMVSKDNKGRIGCLSELLRAKAICKLLNLELKILYSEPNEIDNYIYKNKFNLYWSNWIINPINFKRLGINSNDIIIDGQNLDSVLNIQYTSKYRLFHIFLCPRKLIFEHLHRLLLHFSYYLKFFTKLSLLNIIKSTGGALEFPIPFLRLPFRKNNNCQSKFFLRNLIRENPKSINLNCLNGLRLIRYYFHCVPAIRARFSILRSNYIVDVPASDGTIINKFLFRKSKLKDIFSPKWQLYEYFQNKFSFTYSEYMKKTLPSEMKNFVKEVNPAMVTKFKRNLRKLKYYRENVSESSIIKKYIKEAKPQLKLIVKNAKKKEVRYISELSIKNRKDAFNPVLGFVYDLKRLFQDKNY